MMKYKDGLICGACHGAKVLKDHANKPALCPQCGGRGYLPDRNELKEQQSDKKRVLLKG